MGNELLQNQSVQSMGQARLTIVYGTPGLLCNRSNQASRNPPRLGPLLELNAWKQLRDTLIQEESRKSGRERRSALLLTPDTAPHLPITLDPIEDDETKSDGEYYHEYEPPTTTVVVA